MENKKKKEKKHVTLVEVNTSVCVVGAFSWFIKKGNKLIEIRLLVSELQYSGRRAVAPSGLCVVLM